MQVPGIVLFDEPTRGVDVGAVDHIHNTIRALAWSGKAVVVIPSYLPEELRIADRVLVYRNSAIVTEMDTACVSAHQILGAAAR